MQLAMNFQLGTSPEVLNMASLGSHLVNVVIVPKLGLGLPHHSLERCMLVQDRLAVMVVGFREL